MLYIQHRVNTISALVNTPIDYGVEIDLRSDLHHIYLEHDAFKKGELFIEWIKNFHGKLIVLNVKEDGLEERIESILKDSNVHNFFYLDQPFPTLKRTCDRNVSAAARVSDYEKIDSIHGLNHDWLWIDSFSGDWNHLSEAIEYCRANGVHSCLVSPELQGRSLETKESDLLINSPLMAEIDAICTKRPDWWKSAQI